MTAPELSRRKRLLFTGILVWLPLVPLLLAEGLSALVFHRLFPDSNLKTQGALRYVRSSFRDYQHNAGYVRRIDGVRYRYNNFGFREEADLPAAKPPGEVRIFILGGSAIYGERAFRDGQYHLISGQGAYPSSETVAAHLERLLRERYSGRPIRVLNAAVGSYRINNGLMTYLALVRSLSPDLVLTVDGINERRPLNNPFLSDFGEDYRNGGPWLTFLRQHSYAFYLANTFVLDSGYFDRWRGMDRWELGDEAMAKMDVNQIRRELHAEARGEPADSGFLRGVLKTYQLFARAAELDKIPVVFIVQPVLALDETKRLTEREQKLLKYLAWKKNKQLFLYPLARELSRLASQDKSFRVLDYLNVFSGFEGEAYTDYCHLTPAANRYLAGRLDAYIAREFSKLFAPK